MGWSHDIVAACRTSDRGGGTCSTRARASIPAVGWTFDARGIRLVDGRVGRIVWLNHTRGAFRRATDVLFARKGPYRGRTRRSEAMAPSDGPPQVGTRGADRSGTPAAAGRPISGVRRPGIDRPADPIEIRTMAQVRVAGCAHGERSDRGDLASAGGPSHGASVATVGVRSERSGRGGGLSDAHRIGEEGGPLVDGRCAPLSCAVTARSRENDAIAPCAFVASRAPDGPSST